MTEPTPATRATDPGFEIREPEPYYALGLTVGTSSLFGSDVPDPVSEAMRTGFFGRNFVGIEARRSIPMLFDGFRLEPWLSYDWIFRENSGSTSIAVGSGSGQANLASDGHTINLGVRGTKTLWGEFGLTAGPFVYMEWGGYDSGAKTGGDPTGFWNSVAYYGSYSGKGIGLQAGPSWRGEMFDADLVFEWAHGGRDISYEIPGNPSGGSDPTFSAGTDRYGVRFSVLIHGGAAKVVVPAVRVGEEPPPLEPEPEAPAEPVPPPPSPAPAVVASPAGPAAAVVPPASPPPATPTSPAAPAPEPRVAPIAPEAAAATTSTATTKPPAAAPKPECGDGKVDPGEECDDKNEISDDDCDNSCKKKTAPVALPPPSPPPSPPSPPVAVCGDRTVTAPEGCDDGNVLDDDGCDKGCKVEFFVNKPPQPDAVKRAGGSVTVDEDDMKKLPTIDAFEKVILDAGNYPLTATYLFNRVLLESRVLGTRGGYTIIYQRTGGGAGVASRHYVIGMKTTKKTADEVEIKWWLVRHTQKPDGSFEGPYAAALNAHKGDHVYVRYNHGGWTYNRTSRKISYFVHSDPSGDLPGFMVTEGSAMAFPKHLLETKWGIDM